MKKWFSMLLVCMMVGGVLGGNAEGINIPDITIELPEMTPILANMELSEADTSKKYESTMNGNVLTVETDAATYIVEIPENYWCFTQDKSTSLKSLLMFGIDDESYAQIVETMREVRNLMIFFDPQAKEIHIREIGADNASMLIENLNIWSEDNIDVIGNKMANDFDCAYTGKIINENNAWIQLNQNILLTIVHGNYILAIYGERDMLEDETESFETLISKISIQ